MRFGRGRVWRDGEHGDADGSVFAVSVPGEAASAEGMLGGPGSVVVVE